MHWSVVLSAVLLMTLATNINAQSKNWIRGTYSRDKRTTDDHEIVLPKKVTKNGIHISNELNHHHDNNDDIKLHYQLTISGLQYHLELTPSTNFISPGMLIERRKRNLHTRNSGHDHYSSKCHYRGFIRGHVNSIVALSACNGLAGVLRGDHGEFWLEPVDESFTGVTSKRSTRQVDTERYTNSKNASSMSGRPHFVFRRSTAVEIGADRGRRRKRKKKQGINCGTREPRRQTDSSTEQQPQLVQVQGHAHKKKRWHRSKRSISRPRHVEALVVADTSMMAFHQDGDVETYLLTIMNMVSALYHDPTIGNFINVVVVRIILMEEDEIEGLNITVNADKTLYNFCKWQLKLNPGDDTHPNHHDVAILVTREDICSKANTPCSTLGVAHVGGMCQPDRSCSVNEDNGITLAHTITHELGHNFGMYHDTEKIGCNKRDGQTLHVMTPTFEAETVRVAWSKCSRRDIINFLDQGKGECLEDEPTSHDYAYPELPPGAMYNAEHQCRLQFGVREASVCITITPQEICSKLWCVVNGSCHTMLHPAAPGTTCGKHMWCQNQKCVPMADRPNPIDGGWGEWGDWSKCSRECGAGVSIMERKCDHPNPAHGGKFCIGERRRYKICNTQACPDDFQSFRSMQCSNYDGGEYKDKNYTWLPYFDQNEPCELYCTDSKQTVIVPQGEAVLDGTPCNVGTRDMCIAGICRKVGCDWTVDSDATEDRCGICHGDGTQCETISGIYEKNEGPGYREVIIIPAGSRNIKIEELGNSKNYIGIGVPNTDKYYLNGKRSVPGQGKQYGVNLIERPWETNISISLEKQITFAGEYNVAGTPALYERDYDREKIRIPGPTKGDIVIYLIYRGHYRNFGLRYDYTVPKIEPDRAPEYTWVLSEFSTCTVTCGSGIQTSHAFCQERKSGVVEDKFCNEKTKPDFVLRECNKNPCPARWWIGPWQMCPVTCSIPGIDALRKRSVMCVSSGKEPDKSELALPDRECDKNIKPEEFGKCHNLPICGSTSEIPIIFYGDNKVFSFYNTTNEQNTVDKNTTDDPEILEFDNDENSDNSMYNTKPKWLVSKWSQCTQGKRTRKVTCSMTGDCNSKNKPASSEDCKSEKWITGKWGVCNATCAVKFGVKQREVICKDKNTNKVSDNCLLDKKPLSTRRCQYRRQCNDEKIVCKDIIVPPRMCNTYKRMCDSSPTVREKCCATCSKRRRHARHNRRQDFEN
ncbi:A disintegrin and metalloproteinase with thrombospondin motifs 12-like isoform X2 [Aphidius gifuensis]|uniref:A disintegrin and metalloproteinase with thrombospondin motifs 12-like isoform X2 n=1 Tax=Aphidius gifuensis TaxID=684658 RepID=UPI001CDBD681|nr:A disintegrin and metalloproteinase with thrombospondin motifs 12-like isoform X2 [Aphidius gifuensis]